MELPPMILASASPRREQLLRQLDLEFTVQSAAVEESRGGHFTPRELCLINAYHKAHAVAKANPDHLVLGSDTIVCVGSRVFGKPKDLEEAHAILGALQGVTHLVLTGVCLIHLRSRRQELFAEASAVTFRPLNALTIRKYLGLIQPLDKAGAYAIQDHGEMIIEKVSGSISNVIGLPLERLNQALIDWPAQSN
jgi:septum formation protein